MELDGRRLRDGSTLETDVCIVGSGPAGITLAREFLRFSCDAVMLESGGFRAERGIQKLNEGDTVGDAYAGLQHTRHRQVAGSANIWNTPVGRKLGAKYVPLDPWDFQQREDVPHSGWPLDYPHLRPFYERAQEICGLGPLAYEGMDWFVGQESGPSLDGHLSQRVYQFGLGRPFTSTYLKEIRESANVRLVHHSTAVRLETEAGGRRIVGLSVGTLSGRRFRVRARWILLAAGAIENARLLLLSEGPGGDALGNQHDWVGRCFMEHPRDYALTLVLRSPDLFHSLACYDARPRPSGSIVGGRMALDQATVLSAGLPNASVSLLPREAARPSLFRLPRRLLACPHSSGRQGRRGGYGWSRMKEPSRWFDGFKLIVNLEQRPHVENRVALSRAMDPLGVPRPEVYWRWRDEEQAGLQQLRRGLASWVEASGLGRVEVRSSEEPDPNACHHAGTTRMHADPGQGVVDPNGRVHGTDNLYITGASVFPTAGFANPTLTIVALALRLADHLASRI
jgi:choline dehydrogenase-like flavoprotein